MTPPGTPDGGATQTPSPVSSVRRGLGRVGSSLARSLSPEGRAAVDPTRSSGGSAANKYAISAISEGGPSGSGSSDGQVLAEASDVEAESESQRSQELPPPTILGSQVLSLEGGGGDMPAGGPALRSAAARPIGSSAQSPRRPRSPPTLEQPGESASSTKPAAQEL